MGHRKKTSKRSTLANSPEQASSELHSSTVPGRAAEAFNRSAVLRYRFFLEQKNLAPSTINVRLAAVRRLAHEAADTGLLSPELAAGIGRVNRHSQARDFAEGCENSGRDVGNRDMSRLIPSCPGTPI
jgi:hypothetical protein